MTATKPIYHCCTGVAITVENGQDTVLHDQNCDLPKSIDELVKSHGKDIYITHGLSEPCYRLAMHHLKKNRC